MAKILFIPMNSIQATIFVKIIRALEGEPVEFTILSLDYYYKSRYPNYLVEPILAEQSMPFKRIADYLSPNPRSILDAEKPDLVVNCQDAMEPFIRQIMDYARKQGIPGLVIQDAFMFQLGPPYHSQEQQAAKTILSKIKAIGRDARNLFAIVSYGENWNDKVDRIVCRFNEIVKGTSTRWGDGQYTLIAVTGEYTKEMLVSQGLDASKIVVIGQPRWDELVTQHPNSNTEKVTNTLRLNPAKRIILLTTQPLVESNMWTKEDRELFITTIINTVARIEGYTLIIKLHPRDTRDAYEEIIHHHNLKDKCILYQNENLHALLRSCDVLLTHICTTALEAMILKKPVIAVDFKYPTKGTPYVDAGAAIGVDKTDLLLEAIQTVLSEGTQKRQMEVERDRFVRHCAYLQDGKASERAARLIMQLIDTKII